MRQKRFTSSATGIPQRGHGDFCAGKNPPFVGQVQLPSSESLIGSSSFAVPPEARSAATVLPYFNSSIFSVKDRLSEFAGSHACGTRFRYNIDIAVFGRQK